MCEAFVIDIGNSSIKFAHFSEGEVRSHDRFSHKAIQELPSIMEDSPEAPLIISSTAAPDVTLTDEQLGDRYVLRLAPDTPVPLKTDYDRSTLGQDRLANAVAGNSLSPGASLVIDAGTCVTYDYTFEGCYHGGSISPGWEMRLKAMHHFTGRLPLIEKEAFDGHQGLNTLQSMQSGAFIGLVSEMDHIISRFLDRYTGAKVFLTGGDSEILAERLENAIFAAPFLTLKGLYEILQHNIR